MEPEQFNVVMGHLFGITVVTALWWVSLGWAWSDGVRFGRKLESEMKTFKHFTDKKP